MNDQTKRLRSHSDDCLFSAQYLYELLIRVSDATTLDEAKGLAEYRGLVCIKTAGVMDSVEPIHRMTHRAHLPEVHPLALAADDPRGEDPGVFVGEYVPDLPEPRARSRGGDPIV